VFFANHPFDALDACSGQAFDALNASVGLASEAAFHGWPPFTPSTR
jgi:hypothetical protein